MRVLFFDVDTLRPDHMGCYGYKRNTTPTIDEIAGEGVIFNNYYCPNAPCLPSRASLTTGQYGIRTGVVGHGGTAADLRVQGPKRSFNDDYSNNGLFKQFGKAGMHTVSFSTFAERHSSWWFNIGFNECFNVGGCGGESAEAITPHVLDWIERNGEKDDWCMHVHFWDPHTPYRTPSDFDNIFADQPLADDWIDEKTFNEHLLHIGPHSANEISMWNDSESPKFPKHPGKIRNMGEMKNFIDQYDCGIKYTDDNIKMIIDLVKAKGLYTDDLAIIITSDHGENMGEMGIYAEHATADEPTCHIPMIIKWPGGKKGTQANALHDNVDLLPTIQELLGTSTTDNYQYDGISYAPTLMNGDDNGKDSIVMTQCCHVCQRSARFGDYLYIRTYHGGYHLFPKEMLFNIKSDPHQTNDIAKENVALCEKGAKIILDWVDSMMTKSRYQIDPLWTVMKEGGPEHARGMLDSYIKRLEGTNRAYGIDLLKQMYPNG